MVWEVTRCRDWTVLVKADRFDILDGALVLFAGEGTGQAVCAFAPDQWASVVPREEGEDL